HVEVKTPPDWDDRAWDGVVAGEFRRAGREADGSAIAALRTHAGEDPSAIASKVAQVVEAVGEPRTLTAEDVEAAVEGHGRRSGFAIADAVADRDPAEALVALRGALEAGEAPLAILGAVVYRFRQLLAVRGGAGPKDAGISPGQHRRLQGIVRGFHPGELAWCHDRLAQVDVDLKGSELPDDLVIELAILDVASSREVGAPGTPRLPGTAVAGSEQDGQSQRLPARG
ncbi:MAG: DNA polymerase III subunit delta, partial [Haloechinothrix sp.]